MPSGSVWPRSTPSDLSTGLSTVWITRPETCAIRPTRRAAARHSPDPMTSDPHLERLLARRDRAKRSSKIRFWKALRRLGFSTYAAYLASPHWADLRQRYLASGLWKGRCQGCLRRLTAPQLHHRTYKRLGHEWLLDLRAVCEPCHAAIHSAERQPHQPGLWQASQVVLKRARKRARRQRAAQAAVPARSRTRAGTNTREAAELPG